MISEYLPDDNDKEIDYNLMPMLDHNFNIKGTELYIEILNYKNMIINLENFNIDDYIDQNRKTSFGYKIYNKGFPNEMILIEVKLSELL